MTVLWLALRGLRSSRTFVLLVLAVALGAGFQISNTSTLDGFEDDLLDDALVHGAGDVRIWPRGPRFEHADAEAAELVRAAGDDAGVIEAVPALVYGGAVAALGPGDRQFQGATVWGVDARATRPPFRLIAGTPLAAGDRGILLGTALAARLEAKVGDAVELRVILGIKDRLLGESNQVSLRGPVRGIVSGTAGSYRAVFVERGVLADAAGRPGTASMIALHLADHGAAAAVAARVGGARRDVDARAWYDDDPGWSSYLGARKAIGGISYAMVIAAIAIPMWALLYIHVLRKRRELAILAALGFRRRELFAICTLQSVLVATIGCAIGAGLGYALSRYFTANPVFSWESLVVRPTLSIGTFVVPSLILIGTSIVAALHPAARAARVAPAVVLRRIE